jgi:protein-tyrosine phosphatase
MAAGLLKKILAEKGNYKVVTAGTGTIRGMRPTRETVQIMSEQNIDVSNHLSQPLSEEIVLEADLILVMELRHKEYILDRWPQVKHKVHLLSEFGRMDKEAKLVDPDIPDPIARPLEFYRQVFEIIQESIIRTVKVLEEER